MKKKIQAYVLSLKGSYAYSGKKKVLYVREPEDWDDVQPFFMYISNLFPYREFRIEPTI